MDRFYNFPKLFKIFLSDSYCETTLKLQYFGHLMWRADSFEKTLMLGKIEGRRRRGQQRMRWLGGITDSMDMNLGKLGSWRWTGRPGVLQFMGLQRVGHDWATELNWRSCIKFKLMSATVYGISQAKTLEWVVISYSKVTFEKQSNRELILVLAT